MMESVLSEDVLDEVEYRRLQALFDKYSPLSLEEIRAEEQEDFKAQVLDEFGLDLGDLDIDMRDPGAALEQVLRKLEEQGWAADGQEAGSGFGTPEARRAGQDRQPDVGDPGALPAGPLRAPTVAGPPPPRKSVWPRRLHRGRPAGRFSRSFVGWPASCIPTGKRTRPSVHARPS